MRELLVLETTAARVVLNPSHGAGLRSFTARTDHGEYQLLRGGDDPAHFTGPLLSGMGSFLMAPWPNRISGGTLPTPYGQLQLPTDAGHAIHGTVRRRAWEVTEHSYRGAVLKLSLEEPWPYDGSVTYEIFLEDSCLVQRLTLQAEEPFPAGCGWHPWFKRKLREHPAHVQADVTDQWELSPNMVPTGVVGTTPHVERLKAGSRFGPGELDSCFVFGESRKVVIHWPELTLTMTNSEAVKHLMVYTPPKALCIEPQTCTVNAFQLAADGNENTGSVEVNPQAPLVAETRWSWEMFKR